MVPWCNATVGCTLKIFFWFLELKMCYVGLRCTWKWNSSVCCVTALSVALCVLYSRPARSKPSAPLECLTFVLYPTHIFCVFVLFVG